MRRTAPTAAAIRQLLRARGYTVKERRIEGWSQARLAPLPGVSKEAEANHYEALARYSSKGVDADVTAMRLAVHGFGCELLLPAVRKYMNITEPVPVPHLDLYANDVGDENARLVEAVAHEMETEFVDVAPVALRRLFEAFQRNADSGPSQGEGDDNFHSSLVSIISYYFGGDLFNAKAIATMMNVDPGEAHDSDLDLVNRMKRIEPEDVDRAYLNLPVNVVVAMATLVRQSADGVLKHLGVKNLTESQVDVLCAAVAPYLVYLANLLRDDICEHGYAILAPIFSLMDAESERVHA